MVTNMETSEKSIEEKNPMAEESGEAYTDFASVYDVFMDETPYQEWQQFISHTLEQYGVNQGDLVLDLGCGTGSLTELMASAGFDMIGVDNSQEMLNIAMGKKNHSPNEILYLLQDMREFELYGTVKAVISVCDSLNYLLEEEELLETFRLVNNYLDPNGIFLFDFNTTFKYEEVIGNTTIAENRENCSFIWENYYEESMNEYDLTIFVKQSSGLFQKFRETHYQRGYTLEEMKTLVVRAGLEFLSAMDADSQQAVSLESERIYILCRECGKLKRN